MPSNSFTGFQILFCNRVTGLGGAEDPWGADSVSGGEADPIADPIAELSDPGEADKDPVRVDESCGRVAVEEAAAEDPSAAVESDLRTWPGSVRSAASSDRCAWTNGESGSRVAPEGDDPGGDPIEDRATDPEADLVGESASPTVPDAPAPCTPYCVPNSEAFHEFIKEHPTLIDYDI
jgi:hypothetical protein